MRGPLAASVGALLLLGLSPVSASAAPIQFVASHENFLLFDDVDGTVQRNEFFTREPFLSIYGDIEAGYLAAHPDDSQFLIVYTTWSLPDGVGALYQALANDVQGIGYLHAAELDPIIPAAVFDDTPASQVQGFMHMNAWTQYLGDDGDGDDIDDGLVSLVFGQELGHAWLAFVNIQHPLLEPEALLGRSAAHWGFYVHTSGSPLEGHDWTDNGDGTFTATPVDVYQFSDLDLYLMGLLPAEQVQPWFVITDVSNCVDSTLPDQACAPVAAHRFNAPTYTVDGLRQDVTIEDVIAIEGVRIPAVGQAPNRYDASFLVIKRPNEVLSSDDVERINRIIDRSLDIFNAQTRGLAEVVNRTHDPNAADPGEGDATDGAASTGPEPDPPGGAQGTASGGGVTSATDGASQLPPQAQHDEGCGCRTRDEAPPPVLTLGCWLAMLGRRRKQARNRPG